MHLTAIRLCGFKSFADNTLFPVDAPVTGIIGPNGCGKSNIIDAVRWVLGESAAKQLRGQAMTDVIFAGAKNRRAGGTASVELIFDNSAGDAGGAFNEYAEIVIRRRVSTDGQSQYSINGKRVRRRDIIELLQGTGVGARSYAVIEQGTISRIIEAKPEELRAFIEEAAGIALYKTRRKESESRMNEVKELLTRHDDRLNQLGKQRDKLSQEAEVARKYRQLQQNLSAQTHRLHSRHYHQIGEKLTALGEQSAKEEKIFHEISIKDDQDEQQIQQLQQQLAEIQAAHKSAENHSLQSAARLAQTKRALENTRAESEHTAQNIRNTEQRIVRLEQQQDEDSRQNAFHRSEIERLLPQSEQSDTSDALQHSEQTRAAAESALRQLDAAQEAYHHAENTLHACRKRREDAAKQLSRLQQRQQIPMTPAEDEQEQAELLNTQAETLENSLSETRLEAEETAARLDNIRQSLHTLEQQYRRSEQQHAAAQAKLDTLQQLRPPPPEQAPDLSRAAKLIDSIRVETQWQHAIEQYLGDNLNAVLGDELWQSALQHRYPLLVNGHVPPAWQNIIRSPADLAPWFAHLQPLALHDTDIDRDTLQPGIHYLTLDGSLISRNSIHPADRRYNMLTTRKQIEALELQLGENEQQMQHLSEEIDRHEQKRARLQAQQTTLLNRQKQLERQQHDTLHQADLLRQRRLHQEKMYAEQQHNAAILAEDIAAADALLRRAEDETQQAEAALTALPQTDALREQYQQARQLAQQAQETYRQQQEKQQKILQSIEQHRAHIVAADKQQNRNEQELSENRLTLQTLQEKLEELQLQAEEQYLSLETLEQEHRGHEEMRQQQARQVETCSKTLHEQQEMLRDRQHRQALSLERLNHYRQQTEQLQQQQQHLVAEMLREKQEPLPPESDETYDENALIKEINTLKTQLEALGAVNLAAIADFDQISQEYQTLEAQCRDLRRTLTLLENAITKLDGETRTRLQETMDSVNQHFATLFPVLFRGGEAALQWSGNSDILEAGINITVRPPGKNVKNLSVLSGGEKALTAIALVFSLFRLNPAPFCLLDEVDAPLDDANVGRLCALLREMAQQTQFVVITHHKRTMQSCDNLIGVTMSEPGVSRLVAVQFHG